MTWSLSEIEGLALKAARGAGMDWGIAEEAGKATGWLCRASWPGADMLAGLLLRNDRKSFAALRPLQITGIWAAEDGALCPLITGTVFCDMAADLRDTAPVELGPTAYPLLLVPFVASAADLAGCALQIEWDGVSVISANGLSYPTKSTQAALTAPICDRVIIRVVKTPASQSWALANRGDIIPETAQILKKFAHRTYAPDTLESRLAGAGAGLTDND